MIDVRSLTKRFGRVVAVDDLSFHVALLALALVAAVALAVASRTRLRALPR